MNVAYTDGTEKGYDFSDLTPRTPLLRALVDGFAVATGAGGRWTRPSSATTGSNNLRAFYRYLRSLPDPPDTIESLTDETVAEWRAQIEASNAWPGIISNVRSLLADTRGVSESVHVVMRRAAKKPKSRTRLTAMSKREFKRVRTRAWAVLSAAERRIRPNLRLLQEHQIAQSEGRSLGHDMDAFGYALADLAGTGVMDPRIKNRPLSGEALVRGVSMSDYSLFLTKAEAYAGMMLLVIYRGYNPSTVKALEANHHRPDGGVGAIPVRTIRTFKARRSIKNSNSLDNLVGQRRLPAGRVYQLIAELTQPARDTLERRGQRSSLLFIARSKGSYVEGRIRFLLGAAVARGFKSPGMRDVLEVLDDAGKPLHVSLQRLRLTEQVLNRTPRFNSLSVHESTYVLPEKSIECSAAETINAGQKDALNHAKRTFKLRAWTADDYRRVAKDPTTMAAELGVSESKLRSMLAGKLNTAVTSCLDFERSPFFDDGSCRASFLLCLSCSNAVVTPDHLPRLVALHEALVQIGSVVDRYVWSSDYKMAFERLNDLLSNTFTEQEVANARKRVAQDDRLVIERLLDRELDA